MNKYIVEKARAKTNLVLDVLFKRQDSYHELGTLFQSIDLSEEVVVTQMSSGGIDVEHDSAICESLAANLLYKAALLAEELLNKKLNLKIECQKKLPMGAGLGGGSADAAAVLRAIIKLEKANCVIDKEEWIIQSARIGADVPFMLRGGTQWATGIGEVLSDCELPQSFANLKVLVATPKCFVSTAAAYSKIKLSGVERFAGFKTEYYMDPHHVLLSGYNVFEDSVFPNYKELVDGVALLKTLEPKKIMMSGSGASLIALFEADFDEKQIGDGFKNQFRFFEWTRFSTEKEIF